MTRIAIVDDEDVIRERARECVEAAVPEDCHVEICTFASAVEFLNRSESGEVFDVLITDIELPEIDGIELGRRMRESYRKIYLIFLTSYLEYAYDSYKINANQYIDKRDMEERLPGVIKLLASRLEREKTQFRWIRTEGRQQKLYYAEIVYLYKAKGEKYVEYVTESGVYRERVNISDVEKDLKGRGFLMIERGYIVNIKHISGIGKTMVQMDNGDELTVSRARRTKVKEELNLRWREV